MTDPAAKPPLTVTTAAELLARLIERRHAEDRLVVGYDPGFPTMGASPVVFVTGIHAGFDWNGGKVFLTTERQLGPAGDDLKALREQLHEANETLGVWAAEGLI